MLVTVLLVVLGAAIGAYASRDAGAVGLMLLALAGAVSGAVCAVPLHLLRAVRQAWAQPPATGDADEDPDGDDGKIGVLPADRWRIGGMPRIEHPIDPSSCQEHDL